MLTIAFGTETGNTELLADSVKAHFQKHNTPLTVLNLDDVQWASLKAGHPLLVLTSTWGDGEPPSNAYSFAQRLENEHGQPLVGVPYAVFAMGDTAYPEFCKFGQDVDEGLERLGGQRLLPVVMADVDYDAPFAQWLALVSDAVLALPTVSEVAHA